MLEAAMRNVRYVHFAEAYAIIVVANLRQIVMLEHLHRDRMTSAVQRDLNPIGIVRDVEVLPKASWSVARRIAKRSLRSVFAASLRRLSERVPRAFAKIKDRNKSGMMFDPVPDVQIYPSACFENAVVVVGQICMPYQRLMMHNAITQRAKIAYTPFDRRATERVTGTHDPAVVWKSML